jgi:hypothetical protein
VPPILLAWQPVLVYVDGDLDLDADLDDGVSFAPLPMVASLRMPMLSPDVTWTCKHGRRVSFPGPGYRAASSAITLPPMQPDERIDLHVLEGGLGSVLEQKMVALREALLEHLSCVGSAPRPPRRARTPARGESDVSADGLDHLSCEPSRGRSEPPDPP